MTNNHLKPPNMNIEAKLVLPAATSNIRVVFSFGMYSIEPLAVPSLPTYSKPFTSWSYDEAHEVYAWKWRSAYSSLNWSLVEIVYANTEGSEYISRFQMHFTFTKKLTWPMLLLRNSLSHQPRSLHRRTLNWWFPQGCSNLRCVYSFCAQAPGRLPLQTEICETLQDCSKLCGVQAAGAL